MRGFGKSFWRARRCWESLPEGQEGWEALPKAREGSGSPTGGLGWVGRFFRQLGRVGRPSRRAGTGQVSHKKDQEEREALQESQEGSGGSSLEPEGWGGPPEGLGWVGRPFWRTGHSQEGQEWSGVPRRAGSGW